MSESKQSLSLDDLENVAGGIKLTRVIKKTGGVTYTFPDKCPNCGEALVKPRNAKITSCIKCGIEVEAVVSG